MSNTVVVTGASRGIGRQIATDLAASGFGVAVLYNKSVKEAHELVQLLRSSGADAECFCADVSAPLACERAAQDIFERFGKVCALVNNAGIAQQALFGDITPEMWNTMLGTNLTGIYNSIHAFLPAMIHEKQGKIINISSVWGQTGASCEVHYSAAKAGVIGLTKALAKEVAPSGITVNCVCPGVIKTDMLSGFTQDELDSLCEDIPLGRLGTPADISGTVSFLLSPSANYITGQVIAVNGGFYI